MLSINLSEAGFTSKIVTVASRKFEKKIFNETHLITNISFVFIIECSRSPAAICLFQLTIIVNSKSVKIPKIMQISYSLPLWAGLLYKLIAEYAGCVSHSIIDSKIFLVHNCVYDWRIAMTWHQLTDILKTRQNQFLSYLSVDRSSDSPQNPHCSDFKHYVLVIRLVGLVSLLWHFIADTALCTCVELIDYCPISRWYTQKILSWLNYALLGYISMVIYTTIF